MGVRIDSPSSARAQWYDRNASSVAESVSSVAQAPHAATTRWSYVVPSARKANAESLALSMIRTAAATTIGQFDIQIQLIPSGGSGATIYLVLSYGNSQGSGDQFNLAAAISLYSGDTIKAIDEDLSTGGEVSYMESMKVSEYDA